MRDTYREENGVIYIDDESDDESEGHAAVNGGELEVVDLITVSDAVEAETASLDPRSWLAFLQESDPQQPQPKRPRVQHAPREGRLGGLSSGRVGGLSSLSSGERARLGGLGGLGTSSTASAEDLLRAARQTSH